jgi:hypothetical protein
LRDSASSETFHKKAGLPMGGQWLDEHYLAETFSTSKPSSFDQSALTGVLQLMPPRVYEFT